MSLWSSLSLHIGLGSNTTEKIEERTDPVVLVGSDGGKFRLGKNERFEVLRQRHVLGLGVDVDGVKTRLIFVHRVQYYLQINYVNNI